MTQQERDTIALKLTELAVLYGVDKSREQISMFINMIEKYLPSTCENYLLAFDRYVKENKFYPSPMQLKVYLENKVSNDAAANEIASRIRHAVSEHGWFAGGKAKEYIGELGWTIVERAGGWLYICENLGLSLNSLTFYAQTRDVAKSLIEQKEKNTNDHLTIGYTPQNVLNMPIKQIPK